MSRPKCRKRPLSLGRRVTCDYLHASGCGPTAAAERVMNLQEVVDARQQASPRPSWGAIMTKAFARAAGNYPEMRTAYFSFPWAQLGEYDWQIANVIVDRRVGDEDVLFLAPILKPEELALTDLDAHLRRYKDAPIESIRAFREQMRIARLPTLLRRLFWWIGRNVSANRRARHFGTFGVTTMSPFGAKTLEIPSLWSALLHYGTFSPDGTIPVGLAFDHRVMDGAVVGYTLMDMEQILRRDIVAELRSLQGVNKAA